MDLYPKDTNKVEKTTALKRALNPMQKYKNLVLGVFAVLAPIVAYLYQVDPLSLCKGNLPTVPVHPQQLDAGAN